MNHRTYDSAATGIFTADQTKIVAEFVRIHGLKSEQISFDGDSIDPIFDYEALNYLRIWLTDLKSSEPEIVERNEETGFVTARFKLTLDDGREVSEIGSAQVGETMHSGNQLNHILKAQNVAIARAMRRAMRAAGIDLVKAHNKFLVTGEVTTGNPNSEIEKEMKNIRCREIHKVASDWGHSDDEYRELMQRLFGKSSSLNLTENEKSQLVTVYRSMINGRQNADSGYQRQAA